MSMAVSKRSISLSILSLIIVAFGQPAWSPLFGLLAAAFGCGLFWISISSLKDYWTRFWAGTFWFGAVQMVQLSWALTHPYSYVYPLWFFMSMMIGMQFGFVVGWMTEERVKKLSFIIFFSSFWTIMEWSRLFLLSGISWNPIGLELTSAIIPLQLVSVAGVFGLSFVVFFTNCLFYRCYLLWRQTKAIALYATSALLPYIFGAIHYSVHYSHLMESYTPKEMVNVLLVQPAFPVEEVMALQDPQSTLLQVYGKWKQILDIVHDKTDKPVDLVVLPEYVVPFGTYYPVFPLDSVQLEFQNLFGTEILEKLPEKEIHLAMPIETQFGEFWMVNNAYWIQSLANIFNAEVVAGLEDSEEFIDKPKEHYSSAMVFFPKAGSIERYEKRVLVPLGEYIPFEFCRSLAARYGVMGSFTPGTKAKVINGKSIAYGLSICYEETYGHIMRDNRMIGAEMLVNLTNDFWYPRSRLPQQHFYHARLRAVEMGIPLVRAANNGVTGAVDSLGHVIDMLGQNSEDPERVSDALYVQVPRYHYRTLYTYTGDMALMLFCWTVVIYFFGMRRLPIGFRRKTSIEQKV